MFSRGLPDVVGRADGCRLVALLESENTLINGESDYEIPSVYNFVRRDVTTGYALLELLMLINQPVTHCDRHDRKVLRFDKLSRGESQDLAERNHRPTHPSIPSNFSRPFAISASSSASRSRITFGGSYSTAS